VIERDPERDERETPEREGPPEHDEDAKVDEESEESFPASDPPAHY
jgi:hypothetical protein